MFCINCGAEINDNLTECPNCKIKFQNNNELPLPKENANEENKYDVSNKGLMALSVVIPIFGLIYFWMFKKELPTRAHDAKKGFVIGTIVYILAIVLFIFIIMPIEKRIILKYDCEHNKNGIYNYKTKTCTFKDGKEEQKIYKKTF